jgi:tetratricopeptide (TPR) repeat protein
VHREEANVRAALDWLLNTGAITEVLRISGALWSYWKAQSQLSEGRRWLETGLARQAVVAPLIRARAAYGAGVLAFQQGDYAGARRWFQEIVERYRVADDTLCLASALNMLGQVTYVQGDAVQARPLLEEALTLQRAVANAPGVASALLHLGVVLLYVGDLEHACELQTESLEVFRGLDDQVGQAWVLNRLSQIALYQCDFDRVIRYTEESIALQKRQPFPDRRCIAFSLINLSLAHYYQGDVQRGVALQQESLLLHDQLRNYDGLAWNIVILGAMAGQHSQYECAAQLYGAAERLREVADCPMPALSQAIYEHDMAAIRDNCNPKLWNAAWAQGRAMDVSDAVALAGAIRCSGEGACS